jgi:S-ribosylhomocysteine lyase LuxS involved in autoinducer biosynthesis
MKALKGNPAMYDPGLHTIGKMQAESNQEHVNSVNYRVVFVSPMQRTLQTCIHLFKNHPNKQDIRFIVLPIIREVLETSNDIAHDID